MRFKKVAGGGAIAQPPVMRIVCTSGIGAEASRSVLHHGWHSRTLRPAYAPNPRLPTTFFRGLRSWLRHSLTHGYLLESLRDSVVCPYLNRIARAVRPYAVIIKFKIKTAL